MRCSIAGCPGEYEQREVVRAVRQGSRIIVIEHIPAEVCNVCGAAPPVGTVPLYKFAESA